MDQYPNLPPDLWPREIYEPPIESGKKEAPLIISGGGILLNKGFLGRAITVGTSPTLIKAAVANNSFLVLNPSRQSLLTTPVLGKLLSTENSPGDSEATPIDVSGYESAHFFTNIEAISGTWDLWLVTYDDLSENWCRVQLLHSGIDSIGTFYSGGGSLGIASRIAFRWSPVLPGEITFSINLVLKSGLGGSASGLSLFCFLGGPNVTLNTGYPLLEGREMTFYPTSNVELWGIANSEIQIRVFEL